MTDLPTITVDLRQHFNNTLTMLQYSFNNTWKSIRQNFDIFDKTSSKLRQHFDSTSTLRPDGAHGMPSRMVRADRSRRPSTHTIIPRLPHPMIRNRWFSMVSFGLPSPLNAWKQVYTCQVGNWPREPWPRKPEFVRQHVT